MREVVEGVAVVGSGLSGHWLIDLPGRDTPVEGLCLRHAALVKALSAACAGVPFVSGQQVLSYNEDLRGVVLTCRGGGTLRVPIAV